MSTATCRRSEVVYGRSLSWGLFHFFSTTRRPPYARTFLITAFIGI